jgi:hypothetical protein
MHRQVGQHAPVQGDIGLFQAIDQAAVAQAIGAGLGIDTRDPQRAELALALTAVTVCILASLTRGIVFSYSLDG